MAATSSDPRRLTVCGVPEGAAALAIAQMLQNNAADVIHVCVHDRELETLAQALPFFAPVAEVLKLPAWDCLPYDRVSPAPALVAERLETLALLATGHGNAPRVVLTTAGGIIQKLPPRALMERAVFSLAQGNTVAREALLHFLHENGYRRAAKAIEPGEFALRGGIVDVVPAGQSGGLRLDFFGDEVESIRAFDPLTQLSSGACGDIVLHPVSEVRLTEEGIARFREGYREQFGAVSREDPLYEAISAGQHFPGMEHWLPLFYERLDTLFDYLPDALVIFSAASGSAIADRQETIADHFTARKEAAAARGRQEMPYHPLPPRLLYLMPEAWEEALARRNAAFFSPFADTASITLGWRAGPNLAASRQGMDNPFEQLRSYAADKRGEGKSTLLACISNGSAERLSALLMEHGAHVIRIAQWDGAKAISGKSIGIAALALGSGFETDALALVTEQDLLGERIVRAAKRRKAPEVFLAEAANFLEGEKVVHREHGIGRYDGLITLEVQGARHDCLKLVYADDDRLFVPVENIDLISRYGSEDEEAALDKLGAASWQARKSKLKARIQIAAETLLKTAAERELKTAPVLIPAHQAYEEFCARFPYMETDDQQRAIDDVLEDMLSGRPMDRLVCGDVGFGKTEVGLRAAFAAVFAEPKTQVAVVVPTTLLARQHYKNFKERFEGFNVNVAQLSRMVPAAAQKKTREGLKDGQVDIVIGTHALLSKQIEFSSLGLLIIDEEQHFGVAQKEKLKSLKADVHVLTLSATPIPRTLHMAMSGVRALSLITTPPVDRLAVRSFVTPWDELILREGLSREKHRGGRAFVVTPRIADIAGVKAKLIEMVPDIRLAVAHGQMTPTALDETMNAFYDGKFDVLLATAIIESGLDIPQANTLIVHRADRFGLSQLYQLRGRVGRGKQRAYAYFLLPPHKMLTPNATRRLEVMQSLDTLGAGFTVASHDMDIRGFGNLVGEEQSGHIREVGIELYQQMLEEAIAALRAEARISDSGAPSSDWSPQINLGLSVLIPETYVADLQLRLGLYRRAAALKDEAELESFAAELIDRFGALPEEVMHLLDTMRLKLLCQAACIARLDAGPKGAVIAFYQDRFPKPEALLAYIVKHPTTLKLRPDQKLVFMKEWKADEEKLSALKKLLEAIAGL